VGTPNEGPSTSLLLQMLSPISGVVGVVVGWGLRYLLERRNEPALKVTSYIEEEVGKISGSEVSYLLVKIINCGGRQAPDCHGRVILTDLTTGSCLFEGETTWEKRDTWVSIRRGDYQKLRVLAYDSEKIYLLDGYERKDIPLSRLPSKALVRVQVTGMENTRAGHKDFILTFNKDNNEITLQAAS